VCAGHLLLCGCDKKFRRYCQDCGNAMSLKCQVCKMDLEGTYDDEPSNSSSSNN
jgi:hypothetical protein